MNNLRGCRINRFDWQIYETKASRKLLIFNDLYKELELPNILIAPESLNARNSRFRSKLI